MELNIKEKCLLMALLFIFSSFNFVYAESLNSGTKIKIYPFSINRKTAETNQEQKINLYAVNVFLHFEDYYFTSNEIFATTAKPTQKQLSIMESVTFFNGFIFGDSAFHYELIFLDCKVTDLENAKRYLKKLKKLRKLILKVKVDEIFDKIDWRPLFVKVIDDNICSCNMTIEYLSSSRQRIDKELFISKVKKYILTEQLDEFAIANKNFLSHPNGYVSIYNYFDEIGACLDSKYMQKLYDEFMNYYADVELKFNIRQKIYYDYDGKL